MLKELVGEEGNKRCDTTVRVTGEVCFINAVNRVCQICMDNASLFVDLSTVSMSGLAVGSLFQFIGRLQSTERKVKFVNERNNNNNMRYNHVVRINQVPPLIFEYSNSRRCICLIRYILQLQNTIYTHAQDCDLQLDPMPAMYLVATVKRNVDGLDLALYKKALQLRRGRLQNS
jgi:hypothetical protein